MNILKFGKWTFSDAGLASCDSLSAHTQKTSSMPAVRNKLKSFLFPKFYNTSKHYFVFYFYFTAHLTASWSASAAAVSFLTLLLLLIIG